MLEAIYGNERLVFYFEIDKIQMNLKSKIQ